MIVIGEKAYLKTYDKKEDQELDINNNINKIVKTHQYELKSTKVMRKEPKTSNNDMYNNIKNKASILNRDKRDIQEKVSEVQIQLQKVESMEESLNKIKAYSLNNVKKAKKEEKNKVKVNKIQKEVDNLNNDYRDKIIELKDPEEIIDIISEAIFKINRIKSKLEHYKSKLINLGCLVEESEKELNLSQMRTETNTDEEIISNLLDFISISGDLNTGIIIDIKI